MRTALLLLILGIVGVAACFFVPGTPGEALGIVGSVLIWFGAVAAFKHIGWF